MKNRRHFQIERPDGIVLDAVAQGPTKGTPLVLLHGFPDSWRAFEPLLDQLPETQPVAAMSQRGHGASSKPQSADAYGAKRFADDVGALLDHLGEQRAYILGHSMGAWAACHFATRFPERLAGLVLIGAFASFARNAGVKELKRDVAALTDPVDPAFVCEFQEAASSPDLPPAFFEMIMTESMRLPAVVWQNVVGTFMKEDVPDDLTGIRTPTRLIWGDRDNFVPRSDRDVFLKQIKTASLSIYEGAGHSPHWERPAEVAQELAAFVADSIQASLSRVG